MSASRTTPVRIVPLGGLGEIGLNLMVLECAQHAIIVDAGVMFPEERDLGIGRLLPNLKHLEQTRPQLEAIILTHAHEDHIGALPYLLRRFPAPIYGSGVTLAFARRSLAEEGPAGTDLRSLTPGTTVTAGPFRIEPVRVTHSTPDAVALAIRTPAGLIVHSGDFKIDPAPVDGLLFDSERFARLGDEGVELLLSDSTNVERPGRSGSESSLKPVLRDVMKRTRRRFFLSSFSSHLHRIRQMAEVAHEAGRYVVPLGRRMAESVRLGMETGQLNLPAGTFIERGEAEFLEPKRLAFLASGSQGEPLSALMKLASDTHPAVHIEDGDVVVLSSRFIPGNERTIHTLVNNLYRRGAEVLYDTVAPVHVSGHANRDELSELIRLVRPRYFVPIHGEYRHLTLHRALAMQAGIPERNCFLLEDGDTLVMTGTGEARRGHMVECGRIAEDGEELGDPSVIRERRALAHDGTVVAVLAVSARTGKIVSGPDLLSRGVVSGDGTSPHMARARGEILERLRLLDPYGRNDRSQLRDEMVRALRRYFSDTTGKRPIIVPFVMEV
ncbi:MAG TPA: ribonuclease J [Candidatus Binataceae bacterium]|nr:ribonuclease J [Candidatus Binataceae bacterium]